MKVGIYAGSFDPITLGHLDIIKRAARITKKLIIAVLNNNAKKPAFSVEERVELIRKVTKDIPGVEVMSFSGLTVDFAKEQNANVLVRGLRAVTDFEYELQIAQLNHKLNPDIDTIFLTTSVEYSYLSSSIVKEIASYGGDISQFVPPEVVRDVYDKLYQPKEN
ncbi:MAG: pantetheine-phosphate adenylyltransferase [Lachnospiraceae bacterium]|jgi:pantetheine-phosphate adenylyltransferase|nr:pantetheine-phosphate adenylyltransferase [Lachnospiraceae bacterium]MBO4789349.1 pantetheine-phosphate adenylyltransferase [Lachnospiraceae bacterium]MBQ2030832.1 pantetheine-phosphate adenylyltransferase [Lachnospiraceae bacterium]MBQ2558230.1 pantetheine-phosphate adenylyltransferase [Lachnospiraceae bacterium]MCR5375390.1 pantetheine-phosphate adenylyltransferase [Lachnospiraceae bacterium]